MAFWRSLPLWVKVTLPLVAAVMLGLAPMTLQVRWNLAAAETARQQNDLEWEARDLYSIARWQPWRTGLIERAGMLAFKAGRYQLAIGIFSAARAEGLTLEGMQALGECFFQIQHFASALIPWKYLIETRQASDEIYEKVIQIYRQEYTDSAMDTAQQWAAQAPGNPRAQFSAGLLTIVNDPQAAAQYLNQAKVLDAALAAKADVLLNAIALSQTQTHTGYQMVVIGRALASLGEWSLAHDAFFTSTSLAPEYAEGWAFLGEARQQLGEDGLEQLKKAAALDPNSVITRSLFALYHRRQGQPEQALELLKAVAQAEPKQAIWLVELGNTLLELKDLPGALGYYQKAVGLEPANPRYWLMLAEFCVAQPYQLREVGLPAARQALSLSPEDPAGLDVMGQVLVGLEDYSSGERFFLQALERDPGFGGAFLHLGQLYLQQSKMDSAREQLTLAVTKASEGSSVQVIARRLLQRYFNEP